MNKRATAIFLQTAAIAVMLLLSACIGAGDNSAIAPGEDGYFPQVTGIDLLGTERNLPNSFMGRLNIVAVAFERDQQADVDTWIAAMPDILAVRPDIRFYEIPLIYELSSAKRFWVNNGMRSGIPDKAARQRTITVYTDRDKFQSLMDMKTESIYLLVLDKDGKILWRTAGPATKETLDALMGYLSEGGSSRK